MHIMLVNDDSWCGEGLQALAKAAREAGHRVTVCAPDRQRSGVSHALTFDRSLKVRRLGQMSAAPGWMTDGTPADCARIGVWLLRDDKPDLVISGINYGANIGAACVYSGTVGAAMEASMAGIPAIAVSLDMGGWAKNGFGPAARITLDFAHWALKHPLKTGEIYNLNVPDLPEAEIRGLKRASLSNLNLGAPQYSLHEGEVSGSYYMFEMSEMPENADPENDLDLLAQGWATVTPLTWNCATEMEQIDI